MHPYEMAATLKERRKEESIKLRYGSLYTVIEALLARGFIVAKETSRAGKRPERTVYTLTPAGLDELRDWLRELLRDPAKEYPQFEAALCLLPTLPPDEALALLRRRSKLIEQNVAGLAGHIAGIGAQNFPPLFLVETEYRLVLLKAEQAFVGELIKRIESGWGPIELWRGIHEDREATLAKVYQQYGGAPMS